MPDYRLSWEIDITAPTPLEAAIMAHEYQQRPGVFLVYEEGEEPVRVDLQEEREKETFFPEWACAPAYGQFIFMAALQTRDGRRTGNALLRQWTSSDHDGSALAIVVTDAGNIIKASMVELKELFHPPEWIMKFPMPAHSAAYAAWLLENPT